MIPRHRVPFRLARAPVARKPARARFQKQQLTSRPLRLHLPRARPHHERRDERPREPFITTGRRFRERYVLRASRDALLATSMDSAPPPARRARVLPCPLAHRPFRPSNIPLAPRPQARLSRPSGWGGSPVPSAARTRKLRRKRYVAHLPSSAATDAVPADVRSDADLVAARTEDVFFSGVREEARVFRPRARLDAPLD